MDLLKSESSVMVLKCSILVINDSHINPFLITLLFTFQLFFKAELKSHPVLEAAKHFLCSVLLCFIVYCLYDAGICSYDRIFHNQCKYKDVWGTQKEIPLWLKVPFAPILGAAQASVTPAPGVCSSPWSTYTRVHIALHRINHT